MPINPRFCRHDWTLNEVQALFALPFTDLLYRAQTVHREAFAGGEIQLSSLMSIKTGGCPEDCAYCPQSAHHDVALDNERLIEPDRVLAEARIAQARGATRFCMGAAWKSPNARDFPRVLEMIRGVKALGLECCATLGRLDAEQARAMKDAGLGYYNHNLDTSREHYGKIITTRDYQERLDTLALVRGAGIKVCCGGILGLGEDAQDRAKLLMELANMPRHPESVPINLLVKVEGTPLANAEDIDPFDFVRAIAVARIMMPNSHVRLSAGRRDMDDALQALCFLAGANSIFFGEKLLTTANPDADRDLKLLARLGLKPQAPTQESAREFESERSVHERARNAVST